MRKIRKKATEKKFRNFSIVFQHSERENVLTGEHNSLFSSFLNQEPDIWLSKLRADELEQ